MLSVSFQSTARVPARLAIILFATTSLTAFTDHALAQQSAAPNVTLPDVVISATGVPTPINQIPSSMTVITADQLDAEQQRTAYDALTAVPGLNIVQTGGPGGLTSVFMRGTNSNHVKVLIDGIDVTDPSNSNDSFDFAHLLTGDIAQIEVLRGPQSGLYGSDAIGGVISITTKKGDGPPKVSATIEGGSFGTLNQKLRLSGSQSAFNYSFNVQHLRSTDTPVTPLNLLAPGEQRNNDSYDNLTLSTKLGVDINQNLSVNFVGRYTDSTLFDTGIDFSVFPTIPSPTQSEQVVHEYFTRGEAVATLFDGRFKNYFGINYSDTWSLETDPGSETTFNAGKRLQFDWRGVADVLPGQTVVIGADHKTETLWESDPQTIAQIDSTGVYAELQSKLYDRFFLVSNVRLDDNEEFGDHVTFRVAPAFIVPWTETKLKASYGTGFKAPTLSELFVNFPSFGFFGNPNLKPEESQGYDIGFEQPLFNNRVRVGATYFNNNITNLIDSTATSFINVGRAKTRGVESFATVALTDRIDLRVDYTYTGAIDEDTGLELLRRPKNKVSVTAGWRPIDPLTLSGTLIAIGDFADTNRDGSIPYLIAPGYAVVNLAATYKLDEHVDLFARVDNLTNTQYQNPTGFMQPGLGVYAGMRLAN
jgi:vitamin B12 transporter